MLPRKANSDIFLELAFERGVWSSLADDGAGYALPAAIYAVSSLDHQDVDLNAALDALDTALGSEPKNTLAPFIVSLFLDRLRERQDIMKVDHLQRVQASILSRLSPPQTCARQRCS
jgi:hypothetical protein